MTMPAQQEEVQEYWAAPEGSYKLILVETEAELEGLSEVAEPALVCALDAEWPPEQTAAQPHASLLQLAFWSPQHGVHVLLLDMLRLPKPAAKHFLQQLFRRKQTLKVGFAMVMDLRAVAAALGGEGGSCVAVVEPALDIGTLHRHLRRRQAPGVGRADSTGLSGIVEAQLGRPLDKTQQCSAWAHRPLAPEQISYAAGDAACLLALLGDMAGRASPEEYPLGPAAEDGKGLTAGAGSSQQQGGSGQQGAGGSGCRDGGGATPVPSVDAGVNADGGSSGGGSPWMACGAERLQAAAEWWGSRLEISGGRAVKQRLPRLSKSKLRTERQEELEGAGFPAHVPWMGPGRLLTGEPRFICDVMTEGLARQLRMVGIDAESLAPVEKSQRYAIYRSLVERAEGEGRVVLTKDAIFLHAGYTYQVYLVHADTKQAQLQEVMQVFGLRVTEEDLLSRCARCNGDFIPQPLPVEQLPEGHGVPEGIQRTHTEFWVCSRCSAVYWQGNQYNRAVQGVNKMLAAMSVR